MQIKASKEKFPWQRINLVERAALDEARREAFDQEIARVGSVTNMKGTILHSLPAHLAITVRI